MSVSLKPIAVVLVAVVIFVFLGRFRMTLIPLVAVPVSIIGTFAVMLLIGYSAKRLAIDNETAEPFV